MESDSSGLTGTVHGKTIELDQSTGLPDGQQVNVTVQPVAASASGPEPGEGIRRAAGAWADDPEGLDEYLHQVRQQREQSRPTLEP